MVHCYKLGGLNIVIDSGSGSIHAVDDVAYDIISAYGTVDMAAIAKKYAPDVTPEDIREVIADIEELKRADKLFAPDAYETLPQPAVGGQLKALCLHVSHTCNMTCKYCFASQGRYNGERALMPLSVGKQAIDFLIASSGTRRNLEVDFFGGEPLMNWDVVKDIVRYAREIEGAHNKNFRFTLTTNGLLIDDEVIEFANREMHNVVLSLDGRRDVHDSVRKVAGGGGSYDEVVPLFKKFVEARNGRGYYMRGTYTRNNTDFTQDILHMADLGFSELSMEPVVAKPGDDCALTDDDLPVLFRQYEILAEEMIKRKKEGRGFTFYHYMIDLTGGPCIYKRVAGCGSGSEYLAVTPQGELFPCHQFVGDAAFNMGDIWQGVTKPELCDEFAACNIYSRNECRDCWARLYCSGGCAANSYNATGSITGVYKYGCELFKKRLECAIMIKVAEAVE